MIGSNHLATGAVIGLAIHNPAVALPVAFASHFVLDALPHFGYKGVGFGALLKHKLSYAVVVIELVGFSLLMYLLRGQNIWVYASAFVAFSPDLVWIARYLLWERRHKKPPSFTFGAISRFHSWIQWGERPWGLAVDVVWLSTMLYVIQQYAK